MFTSLSSPACHTIINVRRPTSCKLFSTWCPCVGNYGYGIRIVLLADVLARRVAVASKAAFYSESSVISGIFSLSFCRSYRGNKYLQFNLGNATVLGPGDGFRGTTCCGTSVDPNPVIVQPTPQCNLTTSYVAIHILPEIPIFPASFSTNASRFLEWPSSISKTRPLAWT
jgi:hypothetical protein